MRVLLDVDGVLADFVGCVLQWSKDRGEPRTRESITEFNIFNCWGCPELWPAFDEYVAQEGVCASLAPMAGSMHFVQALRGISGVELAVATSPYKGAPHWIPERLKWLSDWFAFKTDDCCVWSRKHWINADVLIDDAMHNAVEFVAAGGRVLLLDQPWNQGPTPARVIRCHGYAEVLAAIGELPYPCAS